jgi:thymidylate synthase (FAD)
MSVQLVGKTSPVIDLWHKGITDAEALLVYMARVSNPQSQQEGNNPEKLIGYLIRECHWSPFEMVHLTMEIETPRDISRQILRHRSFSFQEFSQRYAVVTEFVSRECRLQDTKNRQSSIECGENTITATLWRKAQQRIIGETKQLYADAIEAGIAKEVARCVLPEGLTMSRLYMSGNLRSWIHYCMLRTGNGTQKEHQQIANQCWDIVRAEFPAVVAAVEAEAEVQRKSKELYRAWLKSIASE